MIYVPTLNRNDQSTKILRKKVFKPKLDHDIFMCRCGNKHFAIGCKVEMKGKATAYIRELVCAHCGYSIKIDPISAMVEHDGELGMEKMRFIDAQKYKSTFSDLT